jgi:flagellar protein FlbD
MIALTRLNGTRLAINSDLIERVDASPDTVITLVDGTKYLVAESLDDVIVAVREFRAGVVARTLQDPPTTAVPGTPPLRVVSSGEES